MGEPRRGRPLVDTIISLSASCSLGGTRTWYLRVKLGAGAGFWRASRSNGHRRSAGELPELGGDLTGWRPCLISWGLGSLSQLRFNRTPTHSGAASTRSCKHVQQQQRIPRVLAPELFLVDRGPPGRACAGPGRCQLPPFRFNCVCFSIGEFHAAPQIGGVIIAWRLSGHQPHSTASQRRKSSPNNPLRCICSD